MKTRKWLLRWIVGVKMLLSGYPHVWRMVIHRRDRSRKWNWGELEWVTDRVIRQQRLRMFELLQRPWILGNAPISGGTEIRVPIQYGTEEEENEA